ncbi:glycosyltransferase family 39 protein [Blastococcus sp. CT_GayMR19]|uniref:ArnT family glycosyltransferase n=1 Tax=Blastococcus sp. CT_GayMR19 TaxID=2559608 RepID=UPI001430B147|nr:glycosyltransferase family 39 protein [Blastococcus sp. CT_GayMR19]
MTVTSGRVEPPDDGFHGALPLAPERQRNAGNVVATGVVRRVLRRPGFLPTVVVALLVAVPALVLRVWALDSLGLNSDEAVYAGQGASLARDPAFLPYFPVFRAHPLLFQSLLSLEYRIFGVSPLGGRLLSVAFGLATVALTYAIGNRLYGKRVGVLAALLIGVMPYMVVVNRQVLLDGPMVFFTSLALYLLIRFVQTERAGWLYAAAVALGLATLTKETAILLVGGAYAFFALTRKTRLRLTQAALALGVLFLTVLPYPVSLKLAGNSSTGGAFLVWQLLRRANHSWGFYLEVVPPALGLGVVGVVVVGLLLLRRSLTWSEHLLVSWITVPSLFFTIWAVKGFQYLLPIAVPMAVLAAMVVVSVPLPQVNRKAGAHSVTTAGLRGVVAVALVASLAATSWVRVQPSTAGSSFLAGTGGVPGGREAGQWVDENLPEGVTMLALGPSMANIIQFYGQRRVYGLSVSPNPLSRNPVYDPVHNPDLSIRHSDLQFLVWDSFSAERSPFFSDRLLSYAERYHGRIVHQEFINVETNQGSVRRPVIIIYEVRP